MAARKKTSNVKTPPEAKVPAAGVEKAPAKKKSAEKPSVARETPAAVPPSSPPPPAASAAPATEGAVAKLQLPGKTEDLKAKEILLSARKRTGTPAHFKPRKRSVTPVLFTMEDVAEILEKRKTEASPAQAQTASPEAARNTRQPARKTVEIAAKDLPVETRNHAAASLADILGFDPMVVQPEKPENKVPAKWKKYYKMLIELREHLKAGLEIHTEETLKRSSREDSGDLSGYGQHMADAGTDAFDRDFALGVVSSEKEALFEVEEAIDRIFSDTYGICEITGEPISKERLAAVPFTRYSLEGQKQHESMKRTSGHRAGVFGDSEDDELIAGEDEEV